MPRRVLPTLLAAALALPACGGDQPEGPDYRLITPPRYVGAEPIATPTPGTERRMSAADADRLRPVIAAWARAVRRGDDAGATRFFALPAIVYQVSRGPVEIRSKAVAKAFNAHFPCGAELIGTRADGRYVVGTFELVAAQGRECTTPGSVVRVGFVFGNRERPKRFTEWWQAPEGADAEVGPDKRPIAPAAGPDTFEG